MSMHSRVFWKAIKPRGILRGVSCVYNSFISKPKAGYPYRLKIESSAICNLKCTMCPHHVGLQRPLGVLKFEDFKKIHDEVKPVYVNLTELGEPLLNPDIYKIISYGSSKGARI